MTGQVAATLGALGDETRRRVVDLLSGQPLSAGELASRLEVTPAALSRHLRVLRHARIVEVSLDERDQRRHVYALRPEPFGGLRDWAAEVSEFWRAQLRAFSAHAGEADGNR